MLTYKTLYAKRGVFVIEVTSTDDSNQFILTNSTKALANEITIVTQHGFPEEKEEIKKLISSIQHLTIIESK